MSADAVPPVPPLPPQVRLRVELLVEIADPAALTRAAVQHLAEEEQGGEGAAAATVATDPAEALSYLVDPFDLVKGMPGVELAQASWGSEQIAPGAYDDNDWLDEV